MSGTAALVIGLQALSGRTPEGPKVFKLPIFLVCAFVHVVGSAFVMGNAFMVDTIWPALPKPN